MSVSHAVRLAMVVLFSLVLAALAVLAMDREARGQTTSTPALTAEDQRILHQIAEDTRAADVERATKAQGVFTRAARKAYLKPVAGTGTSITPHLAKAGLAGAAAGIWIHNGIIIKNGIECGQTYCPDDLKLDVQFRQALDATGASAHPGAAVTMYRYGKAAEAIITSFSYDPSTRQMTYRYEYRMIQPQYDPHYAIGYVGINDPSAGPQVESFFSTGSNWGGAGNTPYSGPVYSQDFIQGTYHTQIPRKPMGLTITPGEPLTWENPVFDTGRTTIEALPPEYTPAPGDYVPSPEQNQEFVEGIKSDPEYDPAWAKPWLRENFRAPADPQQREALWGPVIGTWTTPGGGECKEYESGAQLCDFPGGSTFVWIVKDWTAWMQSSGGSKEWRLQPADRPPDGGLGDSSWGGGNGEEIPYEKAGAIARHAISKALQGEEDHIIEGLATVETLEEPATELAYKEYVYDVGKRIKPHTFDDGTKMFYDPGKDAVIIYNPSAPGNEGSVYVPTDPSTGEKRGLSYYLERKEDDRPPSY